MQWRWAALQTALAGPRRPRLPFFIEDVEVGSVAREHVAALRRFAPTLAIEAARVVLRVPKEERDPVWSDINLALRDEGLILAWRDESYPVVDPVRQTVLARIERAASRFWGTLTFGAHATGYVAGDDGRPCHLWIARRSLHKATDPGLFDNLIGGGVPHGQTARETLMREGREEAGLSDAMLSAASPGRVIRLLRDVPEGLQHEWLHSFDLCLPPGHVPHNQDGEVAGFRLLPVPQALALAAGETMTVDASLVTLDFALRHALVPQSEALAMSAAALWVRR